MTRTANFRLVYKCIVFCGKIVLQSLQKCERGLQAISSFCNGIVSMSSVRNLGIYNYDKQLSKADRIGKWSEFLDSKKCASYRRGYFCICFSKRSGTVPVGLGHLEGLRVVELADNQLDGESHLY